MLVSTTSCGQSFTETTRNAGVALDSLHGFSFVEYSVSMDYARFKFHCTIKVHVHLGLIVSFPGHHFTFGEGLGLGQLCYLEHAENQFDVFSVLCISSTFIAGVE